jgi:SNF2 family DNA or RNA helicase
LVRQHLVLRSTEPWPTEHNRTVRVKKRVVPFSQVHGLEPLADLEWDPVARLAVVNRQRLAVAAKTVLEAVRQLACTDAEELRSALDTHLAAVLDPHQVRNVSIMTIPGGWGACVFDEQGTGKSLTMIAAFDVLIQRNDVDVLLIVAPKSMVPQWVSEFKRFVGDLYRLRMVVGSQAAKREALAVGADVIVLNYEAVASRREELRLLCRRSRVALAVDESFFVKNPSAGRTIAVKELREWCTRAYVLCGTPAPNAAHDLVAQFDLVDFGFTFGSTPLATDRDEAAIEARQAMTARGVYVRNTKRSVLPTLPGRSYAEVHLDMAPNQQRLYDAIAGQLIRDLQSTSDLTFRKNFANYLARREALMRICSNPRPLLEDIDETPTKLTALDELLKRYIDVDGEKVIVWSRYRFSLDTIRRRYGRYDPALIDGSVTDVDLRHEAVRRFQEDEACRLFVGNPAAAGAGLTLHRARIAVYESLSNQAAHFLQSLDRIHRRGQTRPVEYLILLCNQTLEEVEYRRLLGKADVQSDLLGDVQEARPTRTAMLADLLASARAYGG